MAMPAIANLRHPATGGRSCRHLTTTRRRLHLTTTRQYLPTPLKKMQTLTHPHL
ncbi:hypothetical protein Hamer_G027706, partial [Homarus americanus]